MKNKLLLGLIFFMSFTSKVSAQNIINPVSDAFKDFPTIISTVSGWVRPIAILIYLGLVLYAGFIRQTAGADPEKQKKSMQILIYSTTGFVLIIIAPIIVSTIGAILGVELLTSTN